MKDASFTIQRGSHQTIGFTVTTTEAGTTRLNLGGKQVWVFIRLSEATPILIDKVCRVVNAAEGEVALDLTPVESRLVPEGARAQVEVEIWDNGVETTIGRGRVNAIGGINLDA